MTRVGVWVYSSAGYEKGIMRRLCKYALRVGQVVEGNACVHTFLVSQTQLVRFQWENLGYKAVRIIRFLGIISIRIKSFRLAAQHQLV